jgi:hypothetical protein
MVPAQGDQLEQNARKDHDRQEWRQRCSSSHYDLTRVSQRTGGAFSMDVTVPAVADGRVVPLRAGATPWKLSDSERRKQVTTMKETKGNHHSAGDESHLG